MNVIEDHKILVCLPPRQATRSIGRFFNRCFGMINCDDGGPVASHSHDIPEGKEDYGLIMTVRNPYDRWMSIFSWRKTIGYQGSDEELMREIAETIGGYYYSHQILLDRVDWWIRTEHIVEDLVSIPIVAQNLEAVKDELEQQIYQNHYLSKDKPVEHLERWSSTIYANSNWVFDKFGYDEKSYLQFTQGIGNN